MKILQRLFGKREEGEVPPDELNHWVMAEAENDGRRVIFRLRTSQPALADLASYATGISIRWEYEEVSSGMPPGEVNHQQLAFEEAVEELTMYNGHSFLMLVSTGLGYKEWLFYAKDRDEFMKRLNTALARHPKYPLKIEFYDDPEWLLWKDIVKAVSGERH